MKGIMVNLQFFSVYQHRHVQPLPNFIRDFSIPYYAQFLNFIGNEVHLGGQSNVNLFPSKISGLDP